MCDETIEENALHHIEEDAHELSGELTSVTKKNKKTGDDTCRRLCPTHSTNKIYYKIMYNTSFTSMTGLPIIFINSHLMAHEIYGLVQNIENHLVFKYIRQQKHNPHLNNSHVMYSQTRPPHPPLTHKTIAHHVYSFLSESASGGHKSSEHVILRINGIQHNIDTNSITFVFHLQ